MGNPSVLPDNNQGLVPVRDTEDKEVRNSETPPHKVHIFDEGRITRRIRRNIHDLHHVRPDNIYTYKYAL